MKEKISKVKQVAEDIYEVKLPLKGSSLKELSSYIIKGQDRSCIIDVGFETEECTQILLDAAEELGLCCGNTDILLTIHTGITAAICRICTDGSAESSAVSGTVWKLPGRIQNPGMSI